MPRGYKLLVLACVCSQTERNECMHRHALETSIPSAFERRPGLIIIRRLVSCIDYTDYVIGLFLLINGNHPANPVVAVLYQNEWVQL